MSNQLAIASVTKTIVSLLSQAQLNVTTKSPDLAAQDNGSGARINLFLYHTMPNPAWRNRDIPGSVKPGERGNPPLALNLYYLLTAYGEEGTDLADQRVLGQAMRVLHDRPILKAKEVRDATKGDRFLNDSDLHEQIENVRIAPDTLNIEEMSRLWTTFQTQYRVSAAYQAAVVLIDSQRPTKSALPVAIRGKDDRGVQTDVGIDAILAGVEYRADLQQPKLPAARVGDSILLVGSNLPGTNLSAVVRDPKVETSAIQPDIDIVARLQPTVITAGERLGIQLVESLGVWPAGLLSIELQQQKDDHTISSNAVPLAIAPQMQTSDAAQSVIAFVNDQDEKRILQVSLQHPLGDKRRVLLILNRYIPQNGNGNAEQPVGPNKAFFQIPQLPDALGLGNLNPSFDVTKVPPGTYWIRIRVDGIDSMLTQLNEDENHRFSVSFDERQKVEI